MTCLGTARGLETRLVPLRGYELELIPAVPLPRSVTPQLLTVPGRLAGAVHGVGTILDRVGADVLVGFGGYVATPAYLAAKRHKVPIVVHEANPLPGIANRLGAHLTTHVFTGHPDTKLRNGTSTSGCRSGGRSPSSTGSRSATRRRAHFGLRPDLPVLLVFGGSQGAVSLNRALAGAVGAITSAGVQVLHVTGPKHLNEIQPPPGPVPYVAVPYVDRMDLAYAAADFALCRAGAMTCAELTAVGLPAAYVPLPHGNGEQRLNALPIVQRGGGLLVDDAELTADWIKSSLLPVLTNIDQVAGMSEAAAAMGRKDADRWLAKAVIDIVAAEAASRVVGAAAARCQPPRARAGRPAVRRRPAQWALPGAAAARPGRQPSRAACSRRAPTQPAAAARAARSSRSARSADGAAAARRAVAAGAGGLAGRQAGRTGPVAQPGRRAVRRLVGQPTHARPPQPRRRAALVTPQAQPRRPAPGSARRLSRPQAQRPASPPPGRPRRHRQARIRARDGHRHGTVIAAKEGRARWRW